jgi:selenocysteine lyase/cysteine desulfurase
MGKDKTRTLRWTGSPIARTPDATYSITQMRTDVAPGFGANADEIVLTTNTTDGMCMSLNGLD